jgi:hypothetical protein
MEIIGEENVFPATSRILEAERIAWNAAQVWLEAKAPTGEAVLSKADDES